MSVSRLWQSRIDRAQALEDLFPAASPIMRFYRQVLEFQASLGVTLVQKFEPGTPLRAQLDISPALSRIGDLLRICTRSAPPKLAEQAATLAANDRLFWRETLTSALENPSHDPIAFLARACLQPLAEALQAQMPHDSNYSKSTCPACSGLPQLAILRPEGDGGLRFLQCSFCLREWQFRRVVCAWCGEEDKDRLPSYSAEDPPHVRISACDVCHRYVKAVDMTVDGHAVPLVDEVATAALDVWAGDHGYAKISANLMCF